MGPRGRRASLLGAQGSGRAGGEASQSVGSKLQTADELQKGNLVSRVDGGVATESNPPIVRKGGIFQLQRDRQCASRIGDTDRGVVAYPGAMQVAEWWRLEGGVLIERREARASRLSHFCGYVSRAGRGRTRAPNGQGNWR